METRLAVRAHLVQWVNRQVARAVGTWRALAAQRTGEKVKVRSMLMRLIYHRVAGCTAWWREAAQKWKEERLKLRRCLGRMVPLPLEDESCVEFGDWAGA